MEIAILGMGRLGRTVALLLEGTGAHVHRWHRGRPLPASPLAWITVSDEAVAEVAACVPPPTVVLHASARLDLSVLDPHPHAGSLHPAQTFPGPEVAVPTLEGVPAAVDGRGEGLEAARAVAKRLGLHPVRVSGDRRLYHAACVTAGNYSTALLEVARRLAVRAGVPPERALEMLAPLARASLENTVEHGPRAALTGPFSRGDEAAIRAHREALARQPSSLREVYESLARIAVELALDPLHDEDG